MSEQQPTTSEPPHPAAMGERWGDPISLARQIELQALLDKQQEKWVAVPPALRLNSAFQDVPITGADAFWLARRLRNSAGELPDLHLEGASFEFAHMEGADLREAHLERANFHSANMQRAILESAHLEGATFYEARLGQADFALAHLEGASFMSAYMQETTLAATHLEGADFTETFLAGAVLVEASFDSTTRLNHAILAEVSLDEVNFNNVNLAVVDWNLVRRLGDEVDAKKSKNDDGTPKSAAWQLNQFTAAVRANRVLAAALRTQGMNEDADRFAYRAHLLQRQVLRRQGIRKWPSYVGSLLLDVLAGYGFRPGQSIWVYFAVIVWFANFYVWATQGHITFGLAPSQLHALPWYEALVLSVSSFHGRGFFQPLNSLGDPVAILASVEAVFGLIIEVSFIATFTQRFFAR